jgi:FMN reductase
MINKGGKKMNYVILIGSPLRPSRSDSIAGFLKKQLETKGHQAEVISIRDLPAEDVYYADFHSSAVQNYQQLIEKSDGLIVISPVYKASIPGALKAFIDLLPMDILKGKPVFPIMVGGTMSHLLTIEFVLNPLLSVIGATQIARGVYIHDPLVQIKDNGEVSIDPDIQERLQNSLVEFVGFSQSYTKPAE